MTAVRTGAEMVALVQEQTRAARESPSSALLRIVSYGIEGDAIAAALAQSNIEVAQFQKFVTATR